MEKDDSDWKPLSQFLSEPKAAAAGHAAPTVQRLYNRDLSWLNFNDRVLNEAADPSVPALERLRFASIVSSNLDEFFMVRVAEIAKIATRTPNYRYPDGLNARQLLSLVREHALRQKALQARYFNEILDTLAKLGVRLVTEFGEASPYDYDIQARLSGAKAMLCRSAESPPALQSQKIYVFVRFQRQYALVDLGERENRLVELPPDGKTTVWGLADRWVATRVRNIFPGQGAIEAFPFKIIRDADLGYRPDEEVNIEEQILQGIHRRRGESKVIRLEVDAPSYSEGALFLASQLGLDSAALYRFDLPIDLPALRKIFEAPASTRLRYTPVRPQIPRFLKSKDIFDIVKSRDVLLHHPYDSFDIVVNFLLQAARDPAVREINHTLYRTSRESPIIEALKEASRQGKKVAVYVEIKARFDEAANVQWAAELRQAGVKVVQPMGGFKVHSKVTRIVREEDGQQTVYVHLGTGNYHPGTARQYTDLGLLTADAGLGAETGVYFSTLAQRQDPSGYKDLLVAPGNLHAQFMRLIREEIKSRKAEGDGRIVAKMNSLVDPDIIEALYDASRAGVKVDLLVRGICCLRPGISGMSENIRVVSVVDRFLEHSRIYCFGSGERQRLYLSSADWMPRNFFTRYELAFPIKDPHIRRFIVDTILGKSLADNTKAWALQPDGTYDRVARAPGAEPVRSQAIFEQLAESQYQGTILEERFSPKKAEPRPEATPLPAKEGPPAAEPPPAQAARPGADGAAAAPPPAPAPSGPPGPEPLQNAKETA
ncbi:MAG: polyphosphate kinase 1 [Elusimicrobia bacterium]|nr:polyphosphate kinase 1 [Elusimicrobiota bacterium]